MRPLRQCPYAMKSVWRFGLIRTEPFRPFRLPAEVYFNGTSNPDRASQFWPVRGENGGEAAGGHSGRPPRRRASAIRSRNAGEPADAAITVEIVARGC